MGWDNVVVVATCWTGQSRDRIPLGGEIFHISPEAHPASYTMGAGSFPG